MRSSGRLCEITTGKTGKTDKGNHFTNMTKTGGIGAFKSFIFIHRYLSVIETINGNPMFDANQSPHWLRWAPTCSRPCEQRPVSSHPDHAGGLWKRMCSTCESLEPRNPAIYQMKLVQLLYCFSNPWSCRFIIHPEIFKRSCGQRTYKSKANKMPDSFSKLPNVGLHLQSFMPKLGLSGIETRVYINHVDT